MVYTFAIALLSVSKTLVRLGTSEKKEFVYAAYWTLLVLQTCTRSEMACNMQMTFHFRKYALKNAHNTRGYSQHMGQTHLHRAWWGSYHDKPHQPSQKNVEKKLLTWFMIKKIKPRSQDAVFFSCKCYIYIYTQLNRVPIVTHVDFCC